MEWMLLPLRRYAEFSGRSRRKEYWMFALLMIIVYAFAGALMMSVLLPSIRSGTPIDWPAVPATFWLGALILGVFVIAVIVPAIAVTVRRLHDRDMSGWWYLGVLLVGQVPYIGGLVHIAFLVLMCLPGTPGANRYGPDPKDPSHAEVFA